MTGYPLRSRAAGLLFLLTILLAANRSLHAQSKVLHIDPHQTDPAMETVQGPHLAVYDPAVPSRHQLFLFIPGTHAVPESSLPLDQAFAHWGYHAISIDYENSVATASLGKDPDPGAFGAYRSAIVTGSPETRYIRVTPANSILNRIEKLLTYLVQHDPAGGWSEFLPNGKPAWDRIIVAGHSQGSGHAAYIGHMVPVNRVLMFSGPQDYMDVPGKPAPWLTSSSATPPSRYFAFLNLEDPYNVHHQIANCSALMHEAHPQILTVQPDEAIHGDPRILINNFPTKEHHNSTLFPQFENVWKYLASTGTSELP